MRIEVTIAKTTVLPAGALDALAVSYPDVLTALFLKTMAP